jgi:hypothetical protein
MLRPGFSNMAVELSKTHILSHSLLCDKTTILNLFRLNSAVNPSKTISDLHLYLNIQFVLRIKVFISVIISSQLRMFRKKVAVCAENQARL